MVLGCFTAAVVLTLAVPARPLLFASVDPAVAEARGVPVRALGLAFVVLLALTITMAVQVVGTLLLFALVVTPAATALRLTARPGLVAAIAVGLALTSVWGGLVLSTTVNLPPSFFIVAVAVLAWLVVLGLSGRRVGRPADAILEDHHPPPDLRGRERTLTRSSAGSPLRVCFRGPAGGRLAHMDTQHDARVNDDSSTTQAEDSRTTDSAAATVARMLANPRRIRRD